MLHVTLPVAIADVHEAAAADEQLLPTAEPLPKPLVVITDLCEAPASGKPPSLIDEPPCADPVVIADEAEAAATAVGEPPTAVDTPPPVAIIDSREAPTSGEPPPPIDEPLPALTVVNAPVRPEAVCVCTSFWGQSLAVSGG